MPGDQDFASVIKSTQSSPTYPKTALNNDWTGTVIVLITIDTTGEIIDIKVIKSTGYEILDQAFISIVKEKWKFKPKQKYGKKYKSTLKLSYTFE